MSYGSYEQRYQVEEFIGEGGMGRVFLGRDSVLQRHVAIKYSREDAQTDATQGQFWYEAVNSGRLDHPCIPPVHDVGVDSRGRAFYVMRLIRGTSLRDVLARPDDPDALGLTRLLNVFVQVCGAVQFAHEAEILHLDIKPDNIMVGTYGEVYLVDWGLSKPLEQSTPGTTVQGTPSYMAPEQAEASSTLTPATDVFALGIILYELTTGIRPFRSDSVEGLLKKIRKAPFDRGAAWEGSPAALRELITECLQKRPEQRPASAAAVAAQVQEFLDGRQEKARQLKDAELSLDKSHDQLADHARLLEEEKQLEKTLAAIDVDEEAGSAEKRELWECQDALHACRRDAAVAMEKALRFLLQAQKDAPHDLRVRRALADVYWSRFQHAEANNDAFQLLYLETQLRQLNLVEIDNLLLGVGTLTLRCTPEPENVILQRLEEEDRVLKPGERIDLPGNNIDNYSLPMGRYQVTLSHPNFRTIVAPIAIGRCQNVEQNWRFRSEDEIDEQFVQIPPGPFIMGGDDRTFASAPRSIPQVDEFAIARFPVTWIEYREFLQSIADRSREAAKSRLPQVSTKDPDSWNVNADGRVDWKNSGNPKEQQWPIFMVTHQDAIDYCAWKSARDGRSYRLPTDEEWEKAARGVDGRTFPWGDQFDASFCKNSKSTPNKAQPEAVGQYPADCSPYGVRDMAGGIREWCDAWFNEKDNQKLVRGGSWNFSSIGSHCAYRVGCVPYEAYVFIGFRLVHDFE